MSVGVVMNQEKSIAKKKEMGSPSTKDFYLESLKLVPGIMNLIPNAKMVSDVKQASDFSYSASTYASPHLRIAGDAGCFIDPFFSSGVHLALASGLSAAVTICAAKRGDCNENTAVKWHSNKVADGYTRFLLIVLSVLKQIRDKDEPVLTDFNESGFDRAFAFFRPSN
jgi:flavin-dependent dehydrogenase